MNTKNEEPPQSDVIGSGPGRGTESLPLGLYAVLLTLLLASRIVASIIFPIYDDAFITYRYARNLADGLGFVYHPGEWVLGATCPAFGVFVALIHKLGLPVPQTIPLINIACDGIVLWLTLRILKSNPVGKSPSVLSAVLFGVFFAISPILSRIAVGGMEVNIYMLGTLGAILLYHRDQKVPAVMLAALCYFLRPEALLLIAILCGLELLSARNFRALRLPAAAFAVLVPLLFVIYRYYGHVLPQSVLAKSQIEHPSVLTNAKMLLAPDPISAVFLLLAVWGGMAFFFHGGFRQNSVLRTLALWFACYVGAYLIARPQIWSWYAEPIQYVQLCFAAIGGANLLGKLGTVRNSMGRPNSPALWPSVGAVAVVACFWVLLWGKYGPSGVTRSVYRPLEQWTRQHDLHKSTILAEDIGVVGYYSNAYIYDTAGLVWPSALRYKTIEKMIEVYRPDYLFLNARQSDIEMLRKSGFAGRYQPIGRYSDTGDINLKMDPKVYPTSWKQDYIFFKRRG